MTNFKIQNMFAPEISDIELSDKELAYVTAIASGVTRKLALQKINLSAKDVKNLHSKFGLAATKNRAMKMTVVAAASKIINKDICTRVAKKYGLKDCAELAAIIP